MTRFQKRTALITSTVGAIGFLIWFYFEPSFEPAIGLILSIGGILSSVTISSKYKKNRLKGTAKFDYSNNNGIYIIGENELAFETKWTRSSDQSIHLYNDPPLISGIAKAINKYQIKEIKDAREFDFTSGSRTIQKYGIALLKNIYGNYAAIKILDIKDNTRGDKHDELYYEYVINPDKKSDFS